MKTPPFYNKGPLDGHLVGAMHSPSKQLSMIVLMITFSLILLLHKGGISHSDPLILSTFALNLVFSTLLFSHYIWRDGLSMASVYGYFCYFFTAALPLAMYANSLWMHGDLAVINPGLIVKANVTILLYNLVWISVYRAVRKRKIGSKLLINARDLTGGEVNASRSLLVLFILSGLAVLLYLVLGESLIFRNSNKTGVYALPGGVMTGMIINGLFRPFYIFFAILLSASYLFGRKELKWYAIAAVALALAMNFPTSVARFYIFVFLVTVISTITIRSAKRGFYGMLLIVVGTFGAILWHPIRWLGTAVFRDSSLVEVFGERFGMSYFFMGHYDAYENYVLGLEFIEEDGLTWGNQLLGVIFSWVPRALWHSKPHDTGEFLVVEYFYRISNFEYVNIAAPMYLEMYINFGIVSIIVGAIFFGVICGFIDSVFDRFRFNRQMYITEIRKNLIMIIYLSSLVGLSLFFWRGSWMTGYTMWIGLSLCMLVLRILVIEKVSRKV